VAGFLFLRLLCPAILGPHLFKICTQVPEGEVARTLLLVSKCIQVCDSQPLRRTMAPPAAAPCAPVLPNITRHVPPAHSVVSFLLQNLANGVVFGAKEPFMEPMNNWVKSNHDRMSACLDEAGRCANPAVQDGLELGAQDLPRCYSALQAMLEQHVLPTVRPPVESHPIEIRRFVATVRQVSAPAVVPAAAPAASVSFSVSPSE